MLIACFPTAALILITKYIWVRISFAKCDLRRLDIDHDFGIRGIYSLKHIVAEFPNGQLREQFNKYGIKQCLVLYTYRN